jgi:hypothetical protein
MPQLPGRVPTASESTMEALRNKIRQLETVEAAVPAMQQQMELMQRRFDQQDSTREIQQMALKMELYKQEAQTKATGEVDKQKVQAKAEMDKVKAQARFDKLEANTKAEMDKREMQVRCDKLEAKAKAEMDKVKAQARCDKLEANAKAEMDKREAQVRCDKLEALLEKGEMQARCNKLEANTNAEMDKLKAALENERKDRLLQQQIAQLKWEARPGQTPQLVYGNHPPAPAASYILQHTTPPANAAPAPHLNSVPHLPISQPLQTLPKNMPLPIEVAGSVQKIMGEQQESEVGKPSSQAALETLPSPPADVAVAAPTAAISVTLSSKRQQQPLPMLQPTLQPSPPSLSTATPVSAKPAQQQQQQQQQQRSRHSNKVPATGLTGAVALPDSAESHFFLSHSQSTGGDQTNAIYLELQQLGFTCWYAKFKLLP